MKLIKWILLSFLIIWSALCVLLAIAFAIDPEFEHRKTGAVAFFVLAIAPWVLYKSLKSIKEQQAQKTIQHRFGAIEIGKTYKINYTDSTGHSSKRIIYVIDTYENKSGNDVVVARCKKANATRTFRRDRITDAIDVETGEICI